MFNDNFYPISFRKLDMIIDKFGYEPFYVSEWEEVGTRPDYLAVRNSYVYENMLKEYDEQNIFGSTCANLEHMGLVRRVGSKDVWVPTDENHAIKRSAIQWQVVSEDRIAQVRKAYKKYAKAQEKFFSLLQP